MVTFHVGDHVRVAHIPATPFDEPLQPFVGHTGTITDINHGARYPVTVAFEPPVISASGLERRQEEFAYEELEIARPSARTVADRW